MTKFFQKNTLLSQKKFFLKSIHSLHFPHNFLVFKMLRKLKYTQSIHKVYTKYTQSIHKYTRFLTKLGKICPFFCEPTPEKCKQRHYSEDMNVNIIIQKPKAWDKKYTGMADKQEGTSRERCPLSLVKMSHIFSQDVLYL